jgi:hypothetical protein
MRPSCHPPVPFVPLVQADAEQCAMSSVARDAKRGYYSTSRFRQGTFADLVGWIGRGVVDVLADQDSTLTQEPAGFLGRLLAQLHRPKQLRVGIG